MAEIERDFDNDLPTRFGNCRCDCHFTPGVYHHVAACCWPDKKEPEFPEVEST